MSSSVIRNFAYDPPTRRLDIEFTSGRRYSYHDVPELVASALSTAPSKGQFFNRYIRDRFDVGRRR